MRSSPPATASLNCLTSGVAWRVSVPSACALEVEQADFVNLADAMRQRTVPVDLVDHRPPDQAEHRNAFFAEAPDVVDRCFRARFRG